MTNNTEPVRALIDQWRDAAEFFTGDAGSDIRETLMACASELESALSQQPAAVDEAMVARFLKAFCDTPGDEAIGADEKVARRWLTAALAAYRKQGVSDE